jgi:serine/threonine protein kinase
LGYALPDWAAAARAIVVELVDKGPVTAAYESLTITDKVCAIMALLLAVRILHGMESIQGDIKPSNVMIGSFEGWLISKLGDFGAARDDADVKATAVPVSHAFSARELLSGDAGSRKSDICSLGMVISCLVTGKYVMDARMPVMRRMKENERGARIDLPGVAPALLQRMTASGLRID